MREKAGALADDGSTKVIQHRFFHYSRMTYTFSDVSTTFLSRRIYIGPSAST